jgi:plasmid maintenance system antidote protein VapI
LPRPIPALLDGARVRVDARQVQPAVVDQLTDDLFFGMEPRFWLNLQSVYDIRVADRELRAKLAPRIRVFHLVAA